MRFSLSTIFAAAMVIPGILAAPYSNEIVQEDGITLQLLEGDVIQRVAVDGTVLGEAPLPEGGLDMFKSLAAKSHSHSQRRDDSVLVQRQCLYGHPCSEDSICYFNGCSGCLFVAQGVGGCV